MTFGQLIECKVRNIFFEKSYAKCGEENGPKPSFEKLKLLKLYTVYFYCMPR